MYDGSEQSASPSTPNFPSPHLIIKTTAPIVIPPLRSRVPGRAARPSATEHLMLPTSPPIPCHGTATSPRVSTAYGLSPRVPTTYGFNGNSPGSYVQPSPRGGDSVMLGENATPRKVMVQRLPSPSVHLPLRVPADTKIAVREPISVEPRRPNLMCTSPRTQCGPVVDGERRMRPTLRAIRLELADIIGYMEIPTPTLLDRVERFEHAVYHRLQVLERSLPEVLLGVNIDSIYDGNSSVENDETVARSSPTHFGGSPHRGMRSTPDLSGSRLQRNVVPPELHLESVESRQVTREPPTFHGIDASIKVIHVVKSSPEEGLGMDLIRENGTLCVNSILENGVIDRMNKRSLMMKPPSDVLEPGDVIFRVNDVCHHGQLRSIDSPSFEKKHAAAIDASMVAECHQATELTIYAMPGCMLDTLDVGED